MTCIFLRAWTPRYAVMRITVSFFRSLYIQDGSRCSHPDSIDPANSIIGTKTRIAADAAARAKFRRYWAFMSPGDILIRLRALRRVKLEAERSKMIPLVLN